MTEVVIKNVSPCTGSHFLCTGRCWINIRPTPLWSFSIRSADTGYEVERECCLACFYVRREMELGNQKGDVLLFDVELQVSWKFGHAVPNVFGPLASDVVGYIEHSHVIMTHRREKQVVHVGVSSKTSLGRVLIKVEAQRTSPPFANRRRQ